MGLHKYIKGIAGEPAGVVFIPFLFSAGVGSLGVVLMIDGVSVQPPSMIDGVRCIIFVIRRRDI